MVQIIEVSWNLLATNAEYRNPITAPSVLEAIRQAIESHEWFKAEAHKIMPEGFGISVGRQECEIRWCDGEGWPVNSVIIPKGESFHFGTYVKRVTYGGTRLLNKPVVYQILHKAMVARMEFNNTPYSTFLTHVTDNIGPGKGYIKLNNETLGGDPAPGEHKQVIIEFFSSTADIDVVSMDFEEGATWPPPARKYFDLAVKGMNNHHDSFVRKFFAEEDAESDDEADNDEADDDKAEDNEPSNEEPSHDEPSHNEPSHEEPSGGDDGGGGGDGGGGDGGGGD